MDIISDWETTFSWKVLASRIEMGSGPKVGYFKSYSGLLHTFVSFSFLDFEHMILPKD